MLRAIIKDALAQENDCDMVGEVEESAEPSSALDTYAADVVVVGSEGLPLPEAWRDVLIQRPNIRVVTMIEHGRDVVLCTSLGDTSIKNLVAALRWTTWS